MEPFDNKVRVCRPKAQVCLSRALRCCRIAMSFRWLLFACNTLL